MDYLLGGGLLWEETFLIETTAKNNCLKNGGLKVVSKRIYGEEGVCFIK